MLSVIIGLILMAKSMAPVHAEPGLHCEQGICWTAGERHDGWICPEGTDPCYPGPNATPETPCFAFCGQEPIIVEAIYIG